MGTPLRHQKNYNAHSKARIPATSSQRHDNKSTKLMTDLRSQYHNKSSQQDDLYGNLALMDGNDARRGGGRGVGGGTYKYRIFQPYG